MAKEWHMAFDELSVWSFEDGAVIQIGLHGLAPGLHIRVIGHTPFSMSAGAHRSADKQLIEDKRHPVSLRVSLKRLYTEANKGVAWQWVSSSSSLSPDHDGEAVSHHANTSRAQERCGGPFAIRRFANRPAAIRYGRLLRPNY